jgi:hypothetical protein
METRKKAYHSTPAALWAAVHVPSARKLHANAYVEKIMPVALYRSHFSADPAD